MKIWRAMQGYIFRQTKIRLRRIESSPKKSLGPVFLTAQWELAVLKQDFQVGCSIQNRHIWNRDMWFYYMGCSLIFSIRFHCFILSYIYIHMCVCIFKQFLLSYILFLDFIYLFFRERGREGEREEGKHRCVREGCLFTPPMGNLACNPGMCPETYIFLMLVMTH